MTETNFAFGAVRLTATRLRSTRGSSKPLCGQPMTARHSASAEEGVVSLTRTRLSMVEISL